MWFVVFIVVLYYTTILKHTCTCRTKYSIRITCAHVVYWKQRRSSSSFSSFIQRIVQMNSVLMYLCVRSGSTHIFKTDVSLLCLVIIQIINFFATCIRTSEVSNWYGLCVPTCLTQTKLLLFIRLS